jgi:small subunit ribosomal protein S6
MGLYEHTLIAKQDLSTPDLENLENKYKDIITKTSGKVIKIEKWGLLSFAKKLNLITKVFIFITNLKLKIRLWKK